MKNFISIIISTFCLLFTFQNLIAQSQVLEECGFDYKRVILLQDPNYLKLEIESEMKIAQYLSQNQSRSSHSIYTIPVVVHVLHTGQPIGTSYNISDAQIQSAITRLNEVYRGQSANSPVDFKIDFSLAKQDPNCDSTSGILRIDASAVPNYSTSGVDYFGDGGQADEDDLKALSKWPETEYFNIWIVNEIEDNDGGSGIQGYANYFYGNNNEGSIMMYNVFGYDPNNNEPNFSLKGARNNSIVVHEFGHYLHLYHTFQGDGDADQDAIGDNCPGDITIGVDSDGCSDTEPHKRHTSQCLSGQLNDCSNQTYGDNTAKNYMSYASCKTILTANQKSRSRAMLESIGISLIYSSGDQYPSSVNSSLSNPNCTPQTSNDGLAGHYTGIKSLVIPNVFALSSSWADDDGGYVDHTGNCQKIINVFEDSTYNIEITTLYNGNNIKGYVDFNSDGDFLDANEEILNLNTVSNNVSPYTSTAYINFTVPTVNGTTVKSGVKLRLRLNADIGNVIGPCHAPLYGQVEDYALIININSNEINRMSANICNGESYNFNGTTLTSSGTYYDTLVGQANSGADSILILTLNINSDIVSNIAQNGNNIDVSSTGGSGSYTVLWSTGETTTSIVPTFNSNFWALVTDSDNCTGDTVFFDVIFVGTNGNKNRDNNISIYPNPTQDLLTISATNFSGIINTSVFDLFGKKLLSTKEREISLKPFKNGIYFLSVKVQEKTSTIRVIKK